MKIELDDKAHDALTTFLICAVLICLILVCGPECGKHANGNAQAAERPDSVYVEFDTLNAWRISIDSTDVYDTSEFRQWVLPYIEPEPAPTDSIEIYYLETLTYGIDSISYWQGDYWPAMERHTKDGEGYITGYLWEHRYEIYPVTRRVTIGRFKMPSFEGFGSWKMERVYAKEGK